MAGIFPSPTGVPPEDAENAYVPANAPIGGAPMYYGSECQTTLYAWALNALVSEILAAVDRLGFAYNSTRVDNLGAALADVIGAIQIDVTNAQNALIALGDRMDDAEADIDAINAELITVAATLLTHTSDITAINNYLNDLNASQVELDPPIAGFTTVEDFLNAAVPLVGNMPTLTLKGNNTAGPSPALNLTVAQVNAMLPLASAALKGLMPGLTANARQYVDGTGAFSEPPLVTTTQRGTVPAFPNDVFQVFRGDGTWGGTPGSEAGVAGIFFLPSAPVGWLKANGAAVLLATYASLAAIYCGDANNPTASWGYKCTNPANPTGTRSIAGTYIVLPDARGEFIRGWDDSRGIDPGRNLWLVQAQAIQSHTHGITDPGHQHGTNPQGDDTGGSSTVSITGSAQTRTGSAPTATATTGITVSSTGDTETRPRNFAALICIKY